MSLPLVTVITPTTPDRKEFTDRAISQFLAQTYTNKEMILISTDAWRIMSDGGIELISNVTPTSIGAKRNFGNDFANGSILLSMDSDDIYLPDYMLYAVNTMKECNNGILGAHRFPMYNTKTGDVHMFSNPGYAAEATLCYKKDTLVFPHVNAGEGTIALKNKQYSTYHNPFFMCIVHGGNTCSHKALPLIKKLPHNEAALILQSFGF